MRTLRAPTFLAVLVIAGCGSSASHPVQFVAAACAAFHKWVLEQPAGGVGIKDPALLATALADAPPGKLSTDLSAAQGDAVNSSQGATEELTTVTVVAQVVSDSLGR